MVRTYWIAGGKVGAQWQLFLITWPTLQLPDIMSMQENWVVLTSILWLLNQSKHTTTTKVSYIQIMLDGSTLTKLIPIVSSRNSLKFLSLLDQWNS